MKEIEMNRVASVPAVVTVAFCRVTALAYLRRGGRVRLFVTSSKMEQETSGGGGGGEEKQHWVGEWYSVPDLRLRGHRFSVPLDYSSDITTHRHCRISVFAREVVSECLFIWQRGTGLSTPLTVSSLSQLPTVEKQADYLKHFRADSIVKDAEFIRVRLVPDAGLWTVLGQVVHQNEKYYKRFPEDIPVIREVVHYLSEVGGVSYPFERVWDPILVPGAERRISYFFLKAFENWVAFDTNPLYALLHESIYCEGTSSRWSAHKVRGEVESIFDPIKAVKEGRPVYFTGEMIFPWMFDEIHALRHLKEAAHLLAEKEDWPPLYDIAALKNNQVPVVAAVYYEDMFVNFKLAMETASKIAGIRDLVTRAVVTPDLDWATALLLSNASTDIRIDEQKLLLLQQQQQEQAINLGTPTKQETTRISIKDKEKSAGKAKKVIKPRFEFQTRSTDDILDDGYRWRKYGQKAVKNSTHPRSYYRCTHHTCNVKKQVQRLAKDNSIVVTTYEGVHNHPCEKLMESLGPLLKQMQFLSQFSQV
ncbi:putative WRKY transcription factor 24 [Acorus gramineus]|uniref:WRKY transcription factor 24 n=1 Tax=Acorus gramineus TaxID=55184 RepID=A0AAV9BK04_ACOGR|nr:putative WRKY transcription factor 24 [Acorus gramineus]